ncbi:MAG: type II secretion system F family protein [Candidatus Sungbacteria bacterium]|uniref:Type II secretion system F family protein n=1 Tax=Candidatus Sungiibacteriota bacterium TaxID=2750080 RepID=A0A932VR70_9BACT|nr:type II secretion system F family protein [Candidatus Sungbacteria bacterium]
MISFLYSAAKRDGQTVRGEREAESRNALAAALRQEGLLLLDASVKGGLVALGTAGVSDLLARIRPISIIDKMFFTRNLAVMIAAGLPLPRALEASGEESSNPKFKKIMADIEASVVKGTSFAEALRPHEHVFGALFIHMVEVGEASGKLTLILKLLGNQMKKDVALRRRVRNAMMYPAIVLAAVFGIGTLMLLYVVPTLTATIEGLGGTLPLTTRLIIATSKLLVEYGLFVLAGIILIAVLIWRFLKTMQGKEWFDRVVIRTPLFGPLVQKFNTARLCRSLSYMLTAGVPIVQSLEITSRVLGNSVYEDAVREAAKGIEKGKELHMLLALHPHIFGPLVNQMVAVGEETGQLSAMLLRLAIFFEEDVADTTKNLSTIIEPVLMLIIGAVVGLFAVSMLQPIYGSLGNI